MQNSEKHNSSYNDDLIDYSGEAAIVPGGGLLRALLFGVGAGVLSSLFSILLTLLNSPTYRQATAEPNNMNLAYLVTGFWCLGIVVSSLIIFGAGFLVGKATLQRRLSFVAGAVAGIVISLGSFVVHYIPNYPENLAPQPGSTSSLTMGLVASLISFLILAMVDGLIGLWGGWMATRRRA